MFLPFISLSVFSFLSLLITLIYHILQKLLSILLLFSLTFQCFSKLGILISYELNKDYIARVLCINKDKPEMHCNGQCYLHKKMQQDTEHKQQGQSTTGSKMELSLFCSTHQHMAGPDPLMSRLLYAPLLIKTYPTPARAILHPPCS